MSTNLENVDSLYSAIVALLHRDHKNLSRSFENRIKGFSSGVEYQEQLHRGLDIASDVVQENLDKMRFECKNLQYECEIFVKEIREAEERHRKMFEKSSQRDIEKKNRLSQIRSEVRMYENILQIGIEGIVNGKLRGVIFKSNGLGYCDLEISDKLEGGKDGSNFSSRQYSRLNDLYAQLEVSGQWKSFV